MALKEFETKQENWVSKNPGKTCLIGLGLIVLLAYVVVRHFI